MALLLKEFRFAWKDLNDALNKIVDAINFNAPLEGSGIRLDETGYQGISINARDDKSGNPDANQQQSQQQQPVIWHGVDWKEVTLIDPVTCEQTKAQILVKSDGGQIQIG